MTWHTNEIEAATVMIQDGDRDIGSIHRRAGRWHVEVLWQGPGGDLKGDFAEYASALAFVEGVQKTITAVESMLAKYKERRR
ncbi:hypothetical protein [Bradyrhizobium erythrophlei]|jgi:hypothetical protein|uniref:Uncharacterized protein n=1 Tax=Bradyrhizobium erythrophlei TaxID=1437360 RepID=A0A1M5PWP1_9BRAD|nr:hypothetical protein [Bradyrhizobium erythrophlei]SHH06080.1 hypothetical protein SAMN05444169_5518 [Bradyrhizobium erythrophlei]HWY76672.1 hypothetical protein [Verrucomicrobiae bacterium]